ncbi:MAG: pyruvate:ferredoxin (flavodoxin) oxidoreductase [Bacillota bacterium]|nr:pyruvate:ferredoxin (flavodoxin) oxidoreductase [Bacillota bacterium]
MSKKVMKTMDGNTAAAHVSYAFTDVAAIFPITPSSPMAEHVDEWAAHGRKNIFGNIVKVSELQSEAGASGSVHGALQGGALTTTYTASQGLLLMIPNMYKISGELLPGVFHVSARSVATQALSIFGDHSDVMAVRQTGFGLLSSASIQEVMDLGAVAHLTAIDTRVPFVHFFDGFRTSHAIQKIEILDYDDLAEFVDFDKVNEFRRRALNSEHPVTRGTAQNPDIFFQAREACNPFYDAVPEVVVENMKKINKLTGRDYKPFNYYGAEDAEKVIIAMGSVLEAAEEAIDYLVAKGEKVGLLKVRLYRPFVKEYMFDVMPSTVKKIAVLDRTKEPGSAGEPLFKDIQSAYYDIDDRPLIVAGRYGLSSKETTPSHIKAVFDNLDAEDMKKEFTVGINDDVTFLSLDVKETIMAEPVDRTRCKFWGLGSDGTVGANKNAIKIIGDNTDLYAQAYFSYDSKKSGGVTVSHLRFGKDRIRSTYLVDNANYIACHNQSYVGNYDVLDGLEENGIFLLNCKWGTSELEEKLPADMKKYLAEKNIKFYIINGTKIAEEVGLGGRINMVMQAAFFKLAKIIDVDESIKLLKEAIEKTYIKKGMNIVEMNWKAVDAAIDEIVAVDVPSSWANETSEIKEKVESDLPDYVKDIVVPIGKLKGDNLPVSTFVGQEDGTFEQGASAFEKRGVAINVPKWNVDTCIQCNKCSMVCPHAAIRPYLYTDEEVVNAPEGMTVKKANGKALAGLQYRISVSIDDCTGCGVCVSECPVNALELKEFATQIDEQANFNYSVNLPEKKNAMGNKYSVKGSQFEKPLFEFSGACAGCGETPYLKAVTQLYGDRMVIANATGCSSIWGGTAPNTVFCKNDKGHGPAWANSLFEDNAEYGFGMKVGMTVVRETLKRKVEELVNLDIDADLKAALNNWLENFENGEGSQVAGEAVKALFDTEVSSEAKELFAHVKENEDALTKKSVWILGGDGWSYDIGYGGLDHVLAANEDVNVLVFDTEVYSNTGGQASKSTPTAAVAKFAAAGMRTKKKDLGLITSSYGYVYVAQVALGASDAHFMKVLKEAEAYDGPSLIIAYSPCIAHGLKAGMGHSVSREKEAVDAGYWHLWRYIPALKEEGKNPFVLDSKEPKADFQEFLHGEIRYTTLENQFPEIAKELFVKAEKEAKERYEGYRRLAEMEY